MFFLRPSGHRLISIGDPASAHFDKTDLIQDGEIHTLDLSGIVPNNTFAVLLSVSVSTVSPDIGKGILFRKKGNSNWIQRHTNYTNVAAKIHYNQGIVFVDADRKMEYITSVYTFWVLDVSVVGYWRK